MVVNVDKSIGIIVNGRKKEVPSDELSFEEVVLLAYDPIPSGPYISITVTYRDGAGRPQEGRLLEGQTVKVKEGTIFNVRVTDKS